MRYVYAATVLCATLLLGGCAGTDDPSAGGLFSYSPKAYEARLRERQGQLDELKAENARSAAETASLEQTRDAKRVEVEAQRRKLLADLEDVDWKLANAEANPRAGRDKIHAAGRKGWNLKRRARGLDGMTVSQKQARLAQLRRELDELSRQAEILSRM